MTGIATYPGGARRVAQIIGATGLSAQITRTLGCDAKPIVAISPAGQLQTLLNVSGTGVLSIAAVSAALSITQALRLRITLDGLVVIDKTVPITTSSWFGVGFPTETYVGSTSLLEVTGASPDPAQFASSLLVEASTSFSGGEAVAHAYLAYRIFE